ncbi:MAG: WYL domain-containing protein [Thermomicrobiales bacterium]
MSRTGRLLELLIALQAQPRFTVAELAARFGVSRRTMLRDLHELSELGVPLVATPGPGGGYGLLPGRRQLPLELATEEAVALILSYEALLAYPQSPFAEGSLSAITKVRAALPPTVIAELDRLREVVAVLPTESSPRYDAPLLPLLLAAARDGAHLCIAYVSRSGHSERIIYPFGLYASAGFWYCACYDYQRGDLLALRADRMASAEVVAGHAPPTVPTLREWLRTRWSGPTETLNLRLVVSPEARRRFDFGFLDAPLVPDDAGGGVIAAAIPATEVAYYATRLLPMGASVRVEAPAELIATLRERARAVVALYD